MVYKTIKGILNVDYIKDNKDVYWLSENSNVKNREVYALVEKTWQGSYRIIRFVFI